MPHGERRCAPSILFNVARVRMAIGDVALETAQA
jgi:hypothetical protein